MKQRLNEHLQMLCKNIGSRPTGSYKNEQAVEYIYNQFNKLGMSVKKQEFDCIDWKNNGAELIIDDNFVSIVPSEYSLPCDVTTEFVCIDSVNKLKETDLSDKIAVLYGDLCKEPLMPKNFTFWNPEEHKLIISLLETKKPKAIITITSSIDAKVSIIEDGDFEIPCGVVSGNLLDVFLKSQTGKASLKIKTERKPSKASNIIATYGLGKQKIVFSAHIDTKSNTTGALDNASGVSVLLALAEILTKLETSYTFEFVLFNGEDYYSTPGEIEYMSTYIANSENYIFAINLDGLGLKNSLTSYSFYECSQELKDNIKGIAEELQNFEEIPAWPMGDHMIFAYSGIPTIAITSTNIFKIVDTITHTPNDNLENIDIEILNQNVNFCKRLSVLKGVFEND